MEKAGAGGGAPIHQLSPYDLEIFPSAIPCLSWTWAAVTRTLDRRGRPFQRPAVACWCHGVGGWGEQPSPALAFLPSA